MSEGTDNAVLGRFRNRWRRRHWWATCPGCDDEVRHAQVWHLSCYETDGRSRALLEIKIDRLERAAAVAAGYTEAAAANIMKLGCDSAPDARCPHCLASNQLAKVMEALDV